jgi:hypothetical protein
MKRIALGFVGVAFALAGLVAIAGADATLSDSLKGELRDAKYAYVSSTRKDGSLGRPAELWFFYHDGAVYVGTGPGSWRVKRIKAGRPAAKIWIGKPNGPSMFQASDADLKDLASFEATGSIVDDPKIHQAMFKAYAEKYPDGWPKHEQGFRTGFKDGSRVLVKYVPK